MQSGAIESACKKVLFIFLTRNSLPSLYKMRETSFVQQKYVYLYFHFFARSGLEVTDLWASTWIRPSTRPNILHELLNSYVHRYFRTKIVNRLILRLLKYEIFRRAGNGNKGTKLRWIVKKIQLINQRRGHAGFQTGHCAYLVVLERRWLTSFMLLRNVDQ